MLASQWKKGNLKQMKPRMTRAYKEDSGDEEGNEGSDDEEQGGEEGVELDAADENEKMDVTEEGVANRVGDHEGQEEIVANMEEETREVTVTLVTGQHTHVIGQRAPVTSQHGSQPLCAEEIMKKFDAMQHSMQQAHTEMHQTFRGWNENQETQYRQRLLLLRGGLKQKIGHTLRTI
ncbi:hypothetical protein Scep_005396 [Stephania cephalantha]|uniref:Uncharacterized protein n=1 Tax=Stephania cephalantha TaxID=152367 RepID=A0AAP0KVY5_9MAGN